MNRNYGRLDGNVLSYAPDKLVIDEREVFNPSAETYLSQGYKMLHLGKSATPAPDGYHYVPDGFEETDTEIARKWKLEQDETIARKFSKLKIYGTIAALDSSDGSDGNSAGTWDTVKAWLKSKTVNGINGLEAFQLAQEISEDHPLFAAWSEEARELLGLSEEQFEALLSQCVLED